MPLKGLVFGYGGRRAADASTEMTSTARRRRFAFVIAHLGPGGAQRVVTNAANALADRGLDVHVVTTLDDHADSYDLDPRVRRHRRWPAGSGPRNRLLGGEDSLARSTADSLIQAAGAYAFLRQPMRIGGFGVQLVRQTRWLRAKIREIEPDAVLSFLTQTNILTLLATRGMPVRTLISERNDPRLQAHRRHIVLMRRLLYRWSDVVTANSRGAVDALGEFVPSHKLAFLPNPLTLSDREAIAFAAPTMITVTRLVEQKGIDVLLQAAALAFQSLPDWRLAIVGDGPLRADLEALAAKLGIAERIDWIGQVDDPTPYLKAAQFFVLTSRFEGSPNALLEAMACGLPAIVSDSSPGPLELVGAEAAGLIVPVEDVRATADAIVKLAGDERLRAELGGAAAATTQVYRLESAMPIWLDLLNGA